jgi:DNA-binding NarL/FixJ family response regulator
MRRAKVVLADDHTVVMEGLRKLLEPHFEIVGTAADGRELVSSAGRIKPDVVLLDISMPGLNGIEAALQLRKDLPGAKIVFLTMHSDPVYLKGALRAGARGYVLKECAAAELVEAIHRVLRGETYITPEAMRGVSAQDLKTSGGTNLTSREREVLQLVAEGKSAKEIAAILKISARTVTFHKANLVQKLGARTTAELTKFAIRHGIANG